MARGIHKSGLPEFFAATAFLDLLSLDSAEPRPLLKRRARSATSATKQIAIFVQTLRHTYLGISASGERSLQSWDDTADPLPKDLMRHAAIAKRRDSKMASTGEGDLQHGLDTITKYLLDKIRTSSQYADVSDWLSVRRKARGKPEALTPERHLLLSETILDIHLSEPSARRRAAPWRRASKPSAERSSKSTTRKARSESTRINGYKVAYFRLNRQLSLRALARTTGLERKLLQDLEKVERKRAP
jgi:hypothetical protein